MNCETCTYYVFDEEMQYYVCEMPLDEDEIQQMLSGSSRSCPYYHYDDEYKIVRKQN